MKSSGLLFSLCTIWLWKSHAGGLLVLRNDSKIVVETVSFRAEVME